MANRDEEAQTDVVSIASTKSQLGSIVRKVEEGRRRVVVSRRGEPKVVIMGLKDFIDTVAPPPAVMQSIQEWSTRLGTDKITMREIDAEVRAARRERRRDLGAA